MTLNITVLTSDMIYQSADYRLSVDGKRLDIYSTKTITLDYFNWTGFVTYTGIGRVGTKDTAVYVTEWLTGEHKASFADVVELIRGKATQWMSEVIHRSRHTFIVAAFVDGIAKAAVISNFQEWNGTSIVDMESISHDFHISVAEVSGGPQILVTGISQIVPSQSRRELSRFIKRYSTDPSRIRRELAKINRAASEEEPEKISPECNVFSQHRDGRGYQESIGNARTIPHSLFQGIDSMEMIHSFLDQHFGPGKWTVKDSVTTKFGQSSSPPPECKPSVVDQDTPQGYNLIQLVRPEGRRARAFAVNKHGTVVGSARKSDTGQECPCIWHSPEELEFLPHLSSYGGRARDINDYNLIVGGCLTPDNATHACIWKSNGNIADIGEALSKHSEAIKITPEGDATGWVSVHPTDGGQLHFRPAFWPHNGSPEILDDLLGAWGEGVDVNSYNHLVIVAHEGRKAFAKLWDGSRVQDVELPNAKCQSFWPKSLADDGTLTGLIIYDDESRGAAVKRPNDDWEITIEPLNGREVSAANKSGLIAGHDRCDEYNIPWIYSEPEQISYLPHLKYHHHRPYMISEHGWIVGVATSDNCCHPLLWKIG